jgi:hypothetical protein
VLIDLYEAAGLHDYVAEETETLARETARRLARSSERAVDHADARPTAPSRAGRADRIRVAVRASAADASHRDSPRPATGGAARSISARQLEVLTERDQLANAHAQFGVERLEDLTFDQASALITALPPGRDGGMVELIHALAVIVARLEREAEERRQLEPPQRPPHA